MKSHDTSPESPSDCQHGARQRRQYFGDCDHGDHRPGADRERAVTRFVSGTGYDWLIELPPALVPWLVFPLLGPLLRTGDHIQVDFVPALLSHKNKTILRLVTSVIALIASIVFLIAGTEAVSLFKGLGQMMELEIEIPIWTMYLAFPVGFAMLTSFALEAILETITELTEQAAPESLPK